MKSEVSFLPADARFARRTRGPPHELACWRRAPSATVSRGELGAPVAHLATSSPLPSSDPQSARGERVAVAARHLLWVVEGVPVVMEVPVRGQEPGLEIGQAVCRRLAQHSGWVLE